jgi:hypothetical protein
LSGLRRRSLSFLILIAQALLIAPPSSRAQTAPPTNSQNCGATIEENLANAQRALQSNDAPPRVALVCLLQANVILNDRLHEVEQGRSKTGTLTAPTTSYTLQQGR